MGRKGNLDLSIEEKKKIATRLNECLKESEYKTQKELSEVSNINKSSINRMFVGDESDNSYTLPNLMALSKVFNVRLDYLLGLSDIKDTDLSIEDISTKTGLNEKSIRNILLFCKDGNENKALNIFLSSILLEDFLTKFYEYINNDIESIDDFRGYPIDNNDVYLVLLSDTLKSMKNFSDIALDFYKKRIEEMETENENYEKDSIAYLLNKQVIDKYKEILGQDELSKKLYKELKFNNEKED